MQEFYEVFLGLMFFEISQHFAVESSQFQLHILQEDDRVIKIHKREHGMDPRIFGGAGEAGGRDVGHLQDHTGGLFSGQDVGLLGRKIKTGGETNQNCAHIC